ncbi:Uncharacterised protein [Candidatus Norongarragalina meridionalis]|nr:Uncharacterised protein [Candidatus Norongarragalina meridionalis]
MAKPMKSASKPAVVADVIPEGYISITSAAHRIGFSPFKLKTLFDLAGTPLVLVSGGTYCPATAILPMKEKQVVITPHPSKLRLLVPLGVAHQACRLSKKRIAEKLLAGELHILNAAPKSIRYLVISELNGGEFDPQVLLDEFKTVPTTDGVPKLVRERFGGKTREELLREVDRYDLRFAQLGRFFKRASVFPAYAVRKARYFKLQDRLKNERKALEEALQYVGVDLYSPPPYNEIHYLYKGKRVK